MRTIAVRTASASYDVVIGSGLLGSLRPRLEKLFGKAARKYFIVTSPEIWALWSGAVLSSFPSDEPVVLFVPAGESAKRLATLEPLAAQLSAAGADRSSVLLALGGGVIGDMAGFLAAIYMRGIDYVQLPTTLLAQVDSSVGGKTGVNLTTGKNLIGAFHHPKRVFADVDTLETLPKRELRAGLFESIKTGLIQNAKLFLCMEEEAASILSGDVARLEPVIASSVRVKAEIVGKDERESGPRMLLNFGHTVGHAIEATAGYGRLLHGEAVGHGMMAALALSHMRGLPEKDYGRARTVIERYGLLALPAVSAAKLLRKTAGDKKNVAGKRRFVLLSKIGSAHVVEDVTEDELRAAIDVMMEASPK